MKKNILSMALFIAGLCAFSGNSVMAQEESVNQDRQEEIRLRFLDRGVLNEALIARITDKNVLNKILHMLISKGCKRLVFDLELIEATLKAGADVGKRDAEGKLITDFETFDDNMIALFVYVLGHHGLASSRLTDLSFEKAISNLEKGQPLFEDRVVKVIGQNLKQEACNIIQLFLKYGANQDVTINGKFLLECAREDIKDKNSLALLEKLFAAYSVQNDNH